MNSNLAPFIPPNLPDAAPVPDPAAFDVSELAGQPQSSPSQVPVTRWEPLVCQMVAQGTPVSVAAKLVKVDEEKVRAFVSGRGREIIKGLIDERPALMQKLLAGAKVDATLALMQIVASSKQDAPRVAAAKQLIEMADEASGKTNKSPETIKRETEAKLKKLMAEKAAQQALNELHQSPPTTQGDG